MCVVAYLLGGRFEARCQIVGTVQVRLPALAAGLYGLDGGRCRSFCRLCSYGEWMTRLWHRIRPICCLRKPVRPAECRPRRLLTGLQRGATGQSRQPSASPTQHAGVLRERALGCVLCLAMLFVNVLKEKVTVRIFFN